MGSSAERSHACPRSLNNACKLAAPHSGMPIAFNIVRNIACKMGERMLIEGRNLDKVYATATGPLVALTRVSL
jgi:hypothetical protein